MEQCPERSVKCYNNCGKDVHYTKGCRNKTNTKEVSKESEENDRIYNVNVFRITDYSSIIGNDFKVQMVINDI